MSDALAEQIELGHVLGAHGIKGWLRIYSSTRPINAIGQYKSWILAVGATQQRFAVRQLQQRGKSLVAQLEGVDDRNQAEALIGAKILVDASQLPPPAPGEYYWRDLIGCEVVNLQGFRFGQVDSMLETGANDVMVVVGEVERLIPFTLGHAVKKVDLESRRIEVDWDPEF